MSTTAIKYLTQQEYLECERNSQERHEYYKGEIFAMSGASFKHNIIEDNLRGALHAFFKGKNCRSFGSNLRVHVSKNSLYTYPDILIVCGPPAFVDGEFDTLTNPAVIIEILSASIADYDRGTKLGLYREIDSLQEYILIDSTSVHVVQYTKNIDGTWTLNESKLPNASLHFKTIDLSILLSELYLGLDE